MNEEYLGVDAAFAGDLLTVPTGDVQVAAERSCLVQDLQLALSTPRGSLWCHASYGMDIYKYLHTDNTEINRLEFVQDIRRVIESDPRVLTGSTIVNVVDWDLHSIRFTASCEPVTGGNPINLVAGYDLKSVDVEVS